MDWWNQHQALHRVQMAPKLLLGGLSYSLAFLPFTSHVTWSPTFFFALAGHLLISCHVGD